MHTVNIESEQGAAGASKTDVNESVYSPLLPPSIAARLVAAALEWRQLCICNEGNKLAGKEQKLCYFPTPKRRSLSEQITELQSVA